MKQNELKSISEIFDISVPHNFLDILGKEMRIFQELLLTFRNQNTHHERLSIYNRTDNWNNWQLSLPRSILTI
jgi:hypothetical protein